MLRTNIHMHVAEQGATKAILGQHTANGCFQNALRVLGQFQGGRAETLTTGVACVTDVLLRFHFGTRKRNSRSINYNDIISTIRVGSEVGLVLTAQAASDQGGHATQ